MTPPVLQTPDALTYPAEAFRVVLDHTGLTTESKVQVVEGRVLLRVLVRADGTVGTVEIASSSGSVTLDEAAVHAASVSRFVPATRAGQPIDAWAMVPVHFVVP